MREGRRADCLRGFFLFSSILTVQRNFFGGGISMRHEDFGGPKEKRHYVTYTA